MARKSPPKRPLEGEAFLRTRKGSAELQMQFTVGGVRVRETTGTSDRAQAAAMATERHRALYARLVLREGPAPLDMRWSDAIMRFAGENMHRTHHGLTSWARAIGPETMLRDTTEPAVAAAVERMRAAGLSPASINRYVALAAVTCRRARDVWGVVVGAWDIRHHRQKEPAGREVFLTAEQARRLMGEACGHLRPILLVELLTGLRMRNCVGLAWENVSLDLGRALLIQKGGRRLRVELPGAAVELLRGIASVPATGPVFRFGGTPCECPHCASPAFHGKPIRDIRRAFAGAARRAGVQWSGETRLRFHDLRHTFASWLLAETGNLQLVREALGHAQISTTQRYAHLLPGQRAAAAEAVAAALAVAPARRAKA